MDFMKGGSVTRIPFRVVMAEQLRWDLERSSDCLQDIFSEWEDWI